MRSLYSFKKRFDKEIDQFLQKKSENAKELSPKADALCTVVQEFIRSGGKRTRPALFFFAYSSYAEQSKYILPLSCCFELFQTFALIHDDAIDNSDTRRGQPTVHKRHDITTAILAGDLALMLADEVFALNAQKLSTYKPSVQRVYETLKQEVIIGEYLDITKDDDVEVIMELKTARYSFMRPVEIGLRLADVSDDHISQWQKIMNTLGIAFQMKDDLIGTFGDVKKTGKSDLSDIQEGKNTLIVKRFLETATEDEKDQFFREFGTEKISEDWLKWYKETLNEKRIPQELIVDIEHKITTIRTDMNFADHLPLCTLVQEVSEFIVDDSMLDLK